MPGLPITGDSGRGKGCGAAAAEEDQWFDLDSRSGDVDFRVEYSGEVGEERDFSERGKHRSWSLMWRSFFCRVSRLGLCSQQPPVSCFRAETEEAEGEETEEVEVEVEAEGLRREKEEEGIWVMGKASGSGFAKVKRLKTVVFYCLLVSKSQRAELRSYVVKLWKGKQLRCFSLSFDLNFLLASFTLFVH